MVDLIPSPEQPVVEGVDVVQVLSHFGLRLIGPVERLPEGLDNINLRAATDGGVVVIREYKLANFNRAQMELTFARFLAKRGFPTPEPMTTIDDSYLIDYRNRPVALFPFVPGIIPETTSVDLARQVGAMLGQLHYLGRGWRGRLPVVDRLNSLREIAMQESDLLGWEEWQAIVNRFLARHGDSLRSVLPILPTGPIHHDAHRKNLIVQDGVIVALLDFGEINLAAFVIDVLRLCHYFAGETKGYCLAEDLAAAAFDGYSTIRQLTDSERQVLNSVFDLVNLSEAAEFLRNPPRELTSLYECRSLQIYLANSAFRFERVL